MNHLDENELALSGSKSVTLKDIAEWAGVSLGTVHRALYGKKGVSEPLRQKILAIAQEAGYVPNQAASLLKRKRQRVFVLAPGPGMSNRYYYDNIWKGFRDYAEELSAFNIEIVELPYYRIAGNQIADELSAALQRYNGEVDGLLASGFLNSGERQVIQNLASKNIPVVIAADKIENVLANVYVDFDTTGRIAAELLSSQLPAGSRILICAGAPDVVSQRGVVQGFTSYIDEKNPELGYVYLYGDGGGEQMSLLSLRLKDMLQRDDSIAAVFCVNARGSAVAAEVFREMGLGGKIRLVGSDIFKENIEAMQDGIMQNIVYKAPHQQAYKAAKILFDYLLRGIPPFQSDVIIKSSIVFQSNLHMYID